MEENINIQNRQIEAGKKIGKFMTFWMGIIVSTILAVHGVLSSGHSTPVLLGISILISIAAALLIGFFIPVKLISIKISGRINNKILKILADNAITNVFYALIIPAINVTLMITLARHQMDAAGVPSSVPRPAIMHALPGAWISGYIISFLVCLVLEPVLLKIARKRYIKKQ